MAEEEQHGEIDNVLIIRMMTWDGVAASSLRGYFVIKSWYWPIMWSLFVKRRLGAVELEQYTNTSYVVLPMS